MNAIPYLITEDVILVGSKTAPRSHPNADKILEAIRNDDFERAIELMDVSTSLRRYNDHIELNLDAGEILYDGKPIHGLLHTRIINMARDNLPIANLLAFLDRVEQNPSYRVREHLYEFIEYGQLPITNRGTFLTRKVTRGNGYDKYSGTFLHTPGAVISMNRRDVDDDPNNTCSAGLHVYSREYSKFFYNEGDALWVCEVDPADVVAIPTDYNNTKMRTCRYTVVSRITDEEDPEYFSSLNYTFDEDYDVVKEYRVNIEVI